MSTDYLENPLYKKIIEILDVSQEILVDNTFFEKGPLKINKTNYEKYNSSNNGEFISTDYLGGNYAYFKLSEDIEFNPINIAIDTKSQNSLFDTDHRLLINNEPAMPFNLGIFAALIIQNHSSSEPDNDDFGIIFDFNGHSIRQSVQHSLLQRFFSIIELAESPFISGQGPQSTNASAANNFKYAKNVVLIDSSGKTPLNFKKSTHYGIHGNFCENIYMYNLHFNDYQVAPISLNQPNTLEIVGCKMSGHDTDKALRGTWSAINFLKPYLLDISTDTGRVEPESVKNSNNTEISLNELLSDIKSAYNKVADVLINSSSGTLVDALYNDLWQSDNELYKHYYKIFANERIESIGAVQDCGAFYGILLGGKGVQIGGFPREFSETNCGKNIILKDIEIDKIYGNPVESISLGIETSKLTDPIGSVLNLFLVFKDLDSGANNYQYNYLSLDTSEYLQNHSENNSIGDWRFLITDQGGIKLYNYVLSAQYFVNEYLKLNTNNNLTSSKITNLTNSILWTNFKGWITNDVNYSLTNLVGKNSNNNNVYSNLILNVDQMLHVTKGCVGLKIDNCRDVTVSNVQIDEITNFGYLGSNLNGEKYLNDTGIGNPFNIDSATGYGEQQNITGYQGCQIRGVSLASSKDIKISNLSIKNVVSKFSSIYGIDIMYDTDDIEYINNFYFNNIRSGESEIDIFNLNYSSIKNPTNIPQIKCVNIDNKNTVLDDINKVSMDGNSEKLDCVIYNQNYSNKIEHCTNNCVLAGTIVQTDNGKKMIQNLTTGDTINGLKIKHLHKIIYDKNLVKIKKNTFGPNIPNKDTYITPFHKLYFRNRMVFAYKFINRFRTISRIDLGTNYVYNIELEKYNVMRINNMPVETYQ